MFDYIKKLMCELPDYMVGTPKTPAANHLFMTNQVCQKLPEKTTKIFHHLVARLFYPCRHTRQDFQKPERSETPTKQNTRL